MSQTTIRLTVGQYAHYVLGLGPAFLPAALRGVRSGALRCIPIVVRSTDTAPPASANGRPGAINTGDFRRRWRSEPLAFGARVYNDHPAASTIELGRRPGRRPPLGAMMLWARRRLGLPPAEARQAAFLAARAIGRRGLAARHVMGRVMDEMVAAVNVELRRELDAALDASHRSPAGGSS